MLEVLEYREVVQEGENLEQVHEISLILEIIKCVFLETAFVLGDGGILVEHGFVQLNILLYPREILVGLSLIISWIIKTHWLLLFQLCFLDGWHRHGVTKTPLDVEGRPTINRELSPPRGLLFR